MEVQVGSQTPAEPRSVSALIEDLGDRRFQVRQKATRTLTSLGRDAVAGLRGALKSENPEIRQRAKSILAKVLGTTTRDRFLDEPTVRNARQIPGWGRLRPLFETDSQAVETLVKWLRAEPRLFEARIVGGVEFAEQLTKRVAAISDFQVNMADTSKQRDRIIDSVHAALFLVATSSSKPSADVDRACDSLFGLRSVAVAMQPKSLTFQLANEWVRAQGSQYSRLLLTLKYGLPAGLPLAEQIVRSKARGSRMEYALHIIGKLGNEEQVDLLKQQLTNKARLSRRRSAAIRGASKSRPLLNFEYQVRDIALAMLWHLHGEHPSDHGFGKRVRDHKWFVFSTGSLGFESQEDRKAAFAEWGKFEEAKTRRK